MIAKLLQPQPNLNYPLMRDPKRNPKCYEMTEEERLESVQRVAELLRKKSEEAKHVYYGA
jgi:hypothetical protein